MAPKAGGRGRGGGGDEGTSSNEGVGSMSMRCGDVERE